MPTMPGKQVRYVHLFRPVSSSMFSRFLGWLRGDNVEFKNPVELIAKNDGREAVRVQTVGTVKI